MVVVGRTCLQAGSRTLVDVNAHQTMSNQGSLKRETTPRAGGRQARGPHEHGRTVSYDDLHQMGLSRAVDEYHKMIVSKSKGCRMASALCGEEECCLAKIVAGLAFRPLPAMLRPECLLCGCTAVWTSVAARLVRDGAVVLIPFAWSYCLLPEQYCDRVMPLWARCLVLVAVALGIHLADRSLVDQRCGALGTVLESLEKHLSVGELRMTACQTSDVSVLRIFDSREDIEAQRKEKQVIGRVKSLVLRYGFFSNSDECQITNVFVAYQWIHRLAEELGEEQLRQEENFTLDSALRAVGILQDSIGIH